MGAAFAALEQGLTPDEMAGYWGYDNPEMGKGYTHYLADGTYEMIRYVADAGIVFDKGDYTIAGDSVTLATNEAVYCAKGAVGVYTVAITDDGLLEVTVVEDACWRRRPPVDGPIYLSPVTP